MSVTNVLLVVYLAAGLLEIVGIAVTIQTYLTEDPENSGLYTIQQAESWWQKYRGPLMIVLGVLVGVGGNIASLYITR